MTPSEQTAILDLLAELSPIQPEERDDRDGYASIEIVFGEPGDTDYTYFDEHGVLRLTLRLLNWEVYNQQITIRDIKEQDTLIPAALLEDPARVQAFLRAWAEVLSRAFDNTVAEFDVILPSHLMFPNVLKLKRPQTQEQLAAALAVKSRLGKYLP